LKGYKLTARGWAVAAAAFMLVVLLVGGIIHLVSPLFLSPAPETSPTPTSANVVFTFPPTPPAYEPTPSPAPVTPAPTPLETAPPLVVTAPPSTPVPANPNPAPPQRPAPAPNPNPAPAPATPAPEPTPGPTPEPTPEPTPQPLPKWALQTASVMFLWNSETMTEPELVKADLAELLPPRGRLEGYVILVDGFRSDDETRGRLAARRAEEVEKLLIEEFSIIPEMIRTSAERPGGVDRTHQRVAVSFEYVGDK